MMIGVPNPWEGEVYSYFESWVSIPFYTKALIKQIWNSKNLASTTLVSLVWVYTFGPPQEFLTHGNIFNPYIWIWWDRLNAIYWVYCSHSICKHPSNHQTMSQIELQLLNSWKCTFKIHIIPINLPGAPVPAPSIKSLSHWRLWHTWDLRTKYLCIWATKKKRPYFPLNPGWLIGILIMVYLIPYITG